MAFALAAVLAVGAALVGDVSARADLPRTLLAAPPAPWAAEAILSAPVDQEMLGHGASGYERAWNDPRGGSQAHAFVYRAIEPVNGAELMADLTNEYAWATARS